MKKILYILYTVWTAAALLLLASCSSSEKENPYVYGDRFIKNVYINTSLIVYSGQTVSIHGRGFQDGDQVLLVSETDKRITAPVIGIAETSAMFEIPNELEKGTYQLYIVRGDTTQHICEVKVWITTSFDVPDLPGYNIKGVVYCKGEGMKGVRVSDGVTTTVTNEQGFYWLNSNKVNGYVFISLPSGYMPVHGSNIVPGFWMSLSFGTDKYDECNFELREVDQSSYSVIFCADLHIAGRSAVDDIKQFQAGFLTTAGELCDQYGADRTYTISLGDVIWDKYWYVQKYFHSTFRDFMKDYPMPFFNNMGNHDNDPWVQGNLAGEAAYKSVWGPNYYSINIGGVHYIILDTMAWINNGGQQGQVGDREYRKILVDDEWTWFREDLASITDKTQPVVICVHCPLYNMNNSTQTLTDALHSGTSQMMLDAVHDFKNVIFMAGHNHRNNIHKYTDNALGWTVGAVCECWWAGGKLSGRSICSDGVPAGVGVYEVKDGKIEWYYRPWESGRDKQFYAYDMNTVAPVIESYASILNQQSDPARDTAGHDYAGYPANAILVNVWNWDWKWNVEILEGGKPLEVTQIYERDPLHSISYDIVAPGAGYQLGGDNSSIRNWHMFRAVASSATSSVEVRVTDRFGNVYSEVMNRPKAFTIEMK